MAEEGSGPHAIQSRGMSQAPAWPNRRSEDWKYTGVLVASFAIAYFLMLIIPYMYDQLNLVQFKAASDSTDLVIQEFKHVADQNIKPVHCEGVSETRERCMPIGFEGLQRRKLISLDYAAQMNATKELTISSFAISAAMQIVIVALIVYLVVSRKMSNATRFSVLFFTFSFVIAVVHQLSPLPHSNWKFYYVFGIMFSLILSLGDYLHRLDVLSDLDDGKGRAFSSDALCARHEKWLSTFGFSFLFLLALLGTISFSLLDYIKTVFGDSFIYFPLIGVLFALVVTSGFVFWGVIRNLYLILSEIEVKIANIDRSS